VFKALIENQTGKILKVVGSDRGGEFSSWNFKEFCDKHGIKREYTIPRTPQQNGVFERQNRSIQQIARSMMNERNIPQTYWVEAIKSHSCIMMGYSKESKSYRLFDPVK
jgi:transposase InsO family protein